jgi:hypothetical protein
MKIFRRVNFGVCPGVEYQPWSIWNPMPFNWKWEFFGAWAAIYECYAYHCCVVWFRKNFHKWVFVMHILLVNFMSKLVNVRLMKTQFFRWSDRHVALQMVLVPQVVVTHRCHHPWQRQRHSWQRKPKYCASSCRRSSRWPNGYNSCNRDLRTGQTMRDHIRSPPTPNLSGWSPRRSLR